jgi:hypothetical protein
MLLAAFTGRNAVRGKFMSAAMAPRLGLCIEYQRLLDACQKSLAAWQECKCLADRNSLASPRLRGRLKRLQADYARVHAMLETHERVCLGCQYLSKVGGLDFESLSSAMGQQRRFG